jgi:hypothetical protein
MTAVKLLRYSGVASIISAVCTFAFFALHPFSGEPPSAATVLGSNYVFVHVLGMVGIVLLLPTLVALYLVQMKRTGWTGLIGFCLALAGSVMIMGFLWADGLYSPLLATRAPLILDQGATQYYTAPCTRAQQSWLPSSTPGGSSSPSRPCAPGSSLRGQSSRLPWAL